MGDFIVFMSILFAFGWGSALILPYVRRHYHRSDSDLSESVLQRLQEDMEDLGERLSRMEEEMRFFGELHAPEGKASLAPGESEEADRE